MVHRKPENLTEHPFPEGSDRAKAYYRMWEKEMKFEMNDRSCRPEINGAVEDMKQYDIVFIGFPIWWYTAPRIINTFLESYDFSGKQIILFATSGGSGFGKTKDDLKVSISKQATLMEGGLLNGKQT